MIIKFDEIKETELKAFYGGDGALIANMYVDEKNKILRGKLVPGASIGLHRHVPTSEIIFILSGEGKSVCDGKEEMLAWAIVIIALRGASIVLSTSATRIYVFMPLFRNSK